MTKPKRNLIGTKFGKLTVLYQADDFIEKNGKHRTVWHCICDCGNEVNIKEKLLKNGDTKSCGCLRKISSKFIDLTNKRFGELIVLRKADKRLMPSGQYKQYWECLCDCGTTCFIDGIALKNGSTKSCGCLRKKITSLRYKKYNTYDLSGEYGIGYTSNEEEFYFDLEDYELIKDYCWHKRPNGYIVSDSTNQTIHMHRLVMGLEGNDNYEIDHKKKNTQNDNRKNNLRIASHSENMRNVGIRNNNTSGVTGVNWDKRYEKWRARICVNKNQIELGYFDDFKEASKVRKEAEEKYFGEWSYDNSNHCGAKFEFQEIG